MPDMDGFELAKLIIAVQYGWKDYIVKHQTMGKKKMKKECPVVAVTAFTS
jgi:hypothetical protein